MCNSHSSGLRKSRGLSWLGFAFVLWLLCACSGPLVEKKFSVKGVNLNVAVTSVEKKGTGYYVYVDISGDFVARKSPLDLRCLRFVTGLKQSNEVWFDSVIYYMPILTPDSEGKAYKDAYWVFADNISKEDLANFRIEVIPPSPKKPPGAGICK